MTGAIAEKREIKLGMTIKEENDLWKFLKNLKKNKSLITASINSNQINDEMLSNGLYTNHSYTITRIAEIIYYPQNIKIIKCRNPWGRKEYNGAWSDNSKEWKYINDPLQKILEYKVADDGEFWMSWNEFKRYFNILEFCYFTINAVEPSAKPNSEWKTISCHGEWIKGGISVCGCNHDLGKSKKNRHKLSLQQYASKTTENFFVIVSLMQKFKREHRKDDNASKFETIMFNIWKKNDKGNLRQMIDKSEFIDSREVTKRFILPVDDYIIVPRCDANSKGGKYLLRLFIVDKV